MTDKKPHHHGNLRSALIQAGLDLLQDGGPSALSIRKLAVKAGVSHAAPAYHFPNLQALKTGLAIEGFKVFAQSMEQELAKVGNDPRDRILAAGKEYLAFARVNTGLFNLMFGGTALDNENPQLIEASERAYGILQAICEPLERGAKASPNGNESNELMIWSLIHGLAGLMLKDRSGRINSDNIFEIYESILPPLKFK